ncbi:MULTISPECIES: serine/threonine-protein kinase [unclassified Nocardia]|uniref:serine/threonine-protein kinase n=1 Tax=Nocardia sp. JCM 34519.1 TaxID=2876119 RepID=UPI001CE43C79|nr:MULTISPECIES: serine/threonine-protein kinase [unclassified Nocardia]
MAPGPRTGTRFGPYELRSLLGKGGMGEVYEAYDTVKDRVVAVKLLADELAKDPVYQVRFRRESQAAVRLADSHVIPIHDWGVIDGVLFIDMLLVRGVDLRTLLRTQGPLGAARAVHIVEQIAAALDAAHAAGLVHRDVKPANILVADKDFAYLADFGIAHTEGDAAVTLVGMAVGSYIYMAPERFDAGEVTGRADIYSLACVLHECLTGASPYPAASMNVLIRSHLSNPPPRPSQQQPGIPAVLDEVIARGMAKDPADRYPTAGALAAAAKAALGAAPAPKSGPTLVVRPPDPAGRQPDPTAVHLGLVPPESTGELSLPAVITPSAPTVVRPTETQFTPLPPQQPAAPFGPPAQFPPTTQLPPVRPFPDAHLYPDNQHSGPHPGARNYPESYPDAQETQYFSSNQPGNWTGPEYPPNRPPFQPEPGPAHRAPDGYQQGGYPQGGEYARGYGQSGGHPQPDEYGPADDYAQTHAYQGEYQDYDGEYQDGYADDHDQSEAGEYETPSRRRSIVAPILFTVVAIVVAAVGIAVGWQVLGKRNAANTATNTSVSAATTLTKTTPPQSKTTTSTPSTSTTTSTLPAGATPCGQTQGGAPLSHAAAGNSVTSCPFAEAVRQAYAQTVSGTSASGGQRSVVAVSPVTGRSYTMTCTSDGRLVTCIGGENAVVYVY